MPQQVLGRHHNERLPELPVDLQAGELHVSTTRRCMILIATMTNDNHHSDHDNDNDPDYDDYNQGDDSIQGPEDDTSFSRATCDTSHFM